MSWQAADRQRLADLLGGWAPSAPSANFLGVVPVNRAPKLPSPSGDRSNPTLLGTWHVEIDHDTVESTLEGGEPVRVCDLVIRWACDPEEADQAIARAAGELADFLDAQDGGGVVFFATEHDSRTVGLQDGGLWAEDWFYPFQGGVQ